MFKNAQLTQQQGTVAEKTASRKQLMLLNEKIEIHTKEIVSLGPAFISTLLH